MISLNDFLTTQQAAERLKVSRSQVSRYIKNGHLEATLVGTQWLVPKQALKKFSRPPKGNPAFRQKAAS